jgi:hypothetical protein
MPSNVLATCDARFLSGLEITLTMPATGPVVLNMFTEISVITTSRIDVDAMTIALLFNKTLIIYTFSILSLIVIIGANLK